MLLPLKLYGSSGSKRFDYRNYSGKGVIEAVGIIIITFTQLNP